MRPAHTFVRSRSGTQAQPLLFGEDEVAHIAATAAHEATAVARAAAARGQEAAQNAALAAIAQTLATMAQGRVADEAAELSRARRLVRAVLDAVAGAHLASAGETFLPLLADMLRELPEAAALTLHVHPDLVEPLRARLPDLARRAGLAGPLEIRGEPSLELAGVRLTWAEGWIEHLPAEIERRLAEQLRAAGPAPSLMHDRSDFVTSEGQDR